MIAMDSGPQACKRCGHAPVVLEIGGRDRDIDACIAGLVITLLDGGFDTVASCCGHGHRPGNIALADGRELIIARNHEEGRLIDGLFPLDIHGRTKEQREAELEAERA